MKLENTFFAKILLVIFSAILIIIFYKGFVTIPNEGDSIDYHIPIAQSFLTGQVFNPINLKAPEHTRFYPANAESILSLFIFFHVPQGLFNVFGIVFLFFASLRASKALKFDSNLSIIFAISLSTLNGILRWADTQIIDIFLLSFFLLALSYLENPKRLNSYFVKLGICFGLLVGTKFSAPFIALCLILVYFKKLVRFLSLKHIIIFFISAIVAGGFWYIRNYLFVGNPFYPQAFLAFPGRNSTILDTSVLDILTGPITGFLGTLNAFISEYMSWAFVIPIVLVLFFWNFKKNKKRISIKLPILGTLIFIAVANLPSSEETNIMTSSMRYFSTSIAVFLLFCFTYFKSINKEMYIPIIVLINIIFLGFPLGYFPKLLFFALPLAGFVYFKGYDWLIRVIEKYV